MLKQVCIENRSAGFDAQQAILPIMTALFVDGFGRKIEGHPRGAGILKILPQQDGSRIFRLADTGAGLLQELNESDGAGERRSIEFGLHNNRQITVRSLICGISNHFNNLLMSIWGNATLIRLKIVADDPLYEQVTQMERLVQSGAFLTHMVLGYLGERRTVAKRFRLNQLITKIRNEIHDCGGDQETRWNFEARLKWAASVQTPRMIAGSTARVLKVLFQGMQAHCMDISVPNADQNQIPRKMETIKMLIARGLEITHQLRLYAGDIKSNKNNIRLDALVKRSASQIAKHHPGIRVECLIEMNPSSVQGDRKQLAFALTELCNNAVEAMPAGGDLKIRLRPQFPIELQRRCADRCYGRNYWVISIEDTGCGISPEAQKRMFEPFYAAPLRHGRKGLGLAAVDGILSSHQGFIQVQSMRGEGTSIHVCLPANA